MLGVIGLLGTGAANASTWSNADLTGVWSDPLNWDTAPVNGSALVFDGSSGTTNTNDTTLADVGLVTLQGGSNWTIGGSDLTLDAGITNTAGANTWAINTTINVTQSFAVDGGSLLDSGTIAGTGGITVSSSGTGVLTLSGANTFTNGFTLNSGTVQVGVDSVGSDSTHITSSAFGTGSAIALNGGTLTSDGSAARTIYQGLSGLAGTVTLGDATNNGALTFASAGTLTGDLTLTVNSPVTFSSAIGGAGFGITESGSGTLTFSGANTFTNGFTLNSGTVQVGVDSVGSDSTHITSSAFGTGSAIALNGGTLTSDGSAARTIYQGLSGLAGTVTLGDATNNGALTFASAGTLTGDLTLTVNSPVTFSSAIGGAGFGITESGSGTLTFSGANTFTNGFTLNSGTVQVGVDSVGSDSTHITSSAFGTGSAIALNGGTLTSDGSAARTIYQGLSGLAGTVTLGDATNNGALTFASAGTLTGDLTLTVNSPVTFSSAIGGAGFGITESGSGTLTFSGANTFTNGFTLNSGTVQVGVDSVGSDSTHITSSAFGTGSAIALNGGTLTSDGSAARTIYQGLSGLAGTVTLGDATNNGALTFASAGTLTGDLTLTVNSPVTFSSAIGGAGFGITESGSGTLTFNGANTWNNGFTLNGGTVQVGVASVGTDSTHITSSAFGTGSAIVLNGGTLMSVGSAARTIYQGLSGLAGSVTLGDATNNGALTFASAGTLTGDLTLTVKSPVTFSSAIGCTGTCGITESGSGTLTFKGANTWNNGFTLNGGTVQVGVASVGTDSTHITSSAFGTGSAIVLNGGTLMSVGSAARTIYQAIQGIAGSVTLGDATNNGALTFASAGTLTGDLTLTVNSPVTFSSAIGCTGTCGITESGSGTLTFNGANTWNNGFTLNGGTVQVGVASVGTDSTHITSSAFGMGSAIVLNGGTLMSDGTAPRTIYQAVIGLNGAVTLGNGTNSGALTFASAVTLTGSPTLTVNSPVTFSGAISSSNPTFGMSQAGSGTLTFKGANTWKNGFTLTSGTVQVGVDSVGTDSTHITSSAFGMGSAIALNGGTLMSDGTASRTIYQAVTSLKNTVTLGNVTNNGALTFASAVTLTGSPVLIINSPVTFSGAISGGFGLTKQGAGTLIVGPNTYSGGTTLNQGFGTIRLGVDSVYTGSTITSGGLGTSILALGGTVGSGTAVRISSSDTTPRTLLNAITNSCGYSATYPTICLGDAVDNGALDLKGGITMGSGGINLEIDSPTTIDGVISGARGIGVNGPSVLTLNGANTYSNGFTIFSGTVQIGVASVGSPGAVTSSAFGTNGAIGLSGGTLTSVGSAARTINQTVTTFAGNVTLGDATNNGALTFAASTATLTGNLTLTENSQVTFSSAIGGTSVGITDSGTGTLTFKGANTWNNGFALNSGTVQIGVASVGSVGAITSSAFGKSPGALALNGGTLSSDGTTARTILQAVTGLKGNVTLGDATNNGALTFSSAGTLTGNLNLTVNSSVTFSSAIGCTGTCGITDSGTGTLTFKGANTWNNGFTLNSGTVQIGVDSVGSDSTHITSSAFGTNPGANPGAIALNGGTLSSDGTNPRTILQAVTSLQGTVTLGDATNYGPLTFASPVTLTGNPTLNVNSSVTFSSAIGSSPYGMTKNGSGTLTLSGANAYTGNTTVGAGTLTLAGSGSLLMDVNNANASSQLLGTGALNLDGLLKLDVSAVTDTTGIWQLVSSGLTTSYALTGVQLASGGAFTDANGVWTRAELPTRVWTFAQSNGTLTLAVPEPGTLALLAAGLLGLLAYAWRKRK